VPVTARFSDGTGLPDIADGDPNANPHGMAVRFHLPDGGEMDIVANSLAFFPVATGEEFLELLQAVAASGPEAKKPTPLESFLASHPAALPALTSAATPASFARETYNGVNAFVFVDAAGKRRPFRFRLEPAEGAEHLTTEDAA
jgi:catalase